MAWRDTNFSAMPPSYDDVIAAGSSVLVRPGTSLSRQITPFTITTPPSNAAPFPVIAEDDNLDEFNDPSLQEPSSVQRQPPPHTRATPTGGGNRSNRPSTTSRPSVTRATPTSRTSNQQQRQRPQRQRPQQQRNVNGNNTSFIDEVALFSMPNIMLNGLTLPKINVDLDTEAHLPNRRAAAKRAKAVENIKCGCGCFWLFGFVIFFLLIAVPVAMILTGLFEVGSCPFGNRIIPNFLYSLGSLLAGLVILRLIFSLMACCKIGNICGSHRSKRFSIVILVAEILFVVVMVVYILLLFFATWYVFSVAANTNSSNELSPDYCSDGFYTAATTMVGASLGLFILIVIYLSVISIFYVLCQTRLTTPTTRSKPRPRR